MNSSIQVSERNSEDNALELKLIFKYELLHAEMLFLIFPNSTKENEAKAIYWFW